MVCKKQLDHEVEKVVQSDPWEQWRGFVDVDDEDRRSFSDESECILKKIETFPVKRLRFARNTILDAADEMVVGAFDAYAYPCEALGFLEVKTDELDIDQKGYVRNEWSYFLLEDILDRQVFETMRNIAVTGAHPKAVRKLKELAPSLIRILLAARKLLGKKMELATKLGLNETAQKLGKACEEFCMIELTGDIDTDAKRLFLERKITPDEFRAAMRRAFMLDRQATEEINNVGHVVNLPHQAATSTLVAQGHGSITGTQKADEYSKGAPKKRQKKRGRKLGQKELNVNVKKNELITEVRRRAKEKYNLGQDGITRAYDEINEESKQPGSKWYTIISLAKRKTIIDKARHNKRYVTV